jgi:CRP/FNR family transcriptional regulator, cyclic AMP receptor protein
MGGIGSGDGFWHRLGENDRTQLSAIGRLTSYRPGAVICTEGEPATHVFILMTGWVKITAVTRDGQEHVLALRGQGDIIGELGEVSGYRTATVRAVDQVRSLLVPHKRFGVFLEAHPRADRAFRQLMTRRWGEANMALLTRSTTTGAQRLAGQLLELAERHGVASADQVSIEMPLSQEELASLVGTSRATLARALADWRHRGFIQTRYRHIAITNADALRKIARRGLAQ